MLMLVNANVCNKNRKKHVYLHLPKCGFLRRFYTTTGDFNAISIRATFFMVAEISVFQAKYANHCQSKDKAIFSPNSLRSMGQTGFFCVPKTQIATVWQRSKLVRSVSVSGFPDRQLWRQQRRKSDKNQAEKNLPFSKRVKWWCIKNGPKKWPDYLITLW